MEKLNDETWKAFVMLIDQVAKQKKLTSYDLAERTGMRDNSIRRIFQLKYCPSLQTFLSLCKAVEVNIFVEDRESKTDLSILFEQAMTELGRRSEKLPKN